LRLGANEAVRAIPFELAAVSAVDQAIIRPALAFEDDRLFGQFRHGAFGSRKGAEARRSLGCGEAASEFSRQ
jgi:hypothetical protein